MSEFNYKKYSLENLENWMYDAMSSAEATPQEIYDVIRGVVQENYYTYKHQTSKAYELLALLNGNGKGHTPNSTKEVKDCMPPWGHSDMEYLSELRYTDEEMNAMCDNASKQDKVVKWQLPIEADSSGEYFITFPDDLLQAANLKEGDEVEWVEQEVGTFLLRKINYKEMIEAGYTMTADGFWIKE